MNPVKKQLDKDIKYIGGNVMALFDDYYNYDVVTEAYFGSKPEFKEIERLLGVIIDRINTAFGPSDGDFNRWQELQKTVNDPKIYSDDTVPRLERLFTKAFDLKSFHLDFFYNHYAMLKLSGALSDKSYQGYEHLGANAFTIPKGFAFFDSEKNSENSMIRSSKCVTAGIMVGVDYIWALDLTPRELMATILHELGHCMDASVFTMLALIPPFIGPRSELFKGNMERLKFTAQAFMLRSSSIAALWSELGKTLDAATEKIPGFGALMASINLSIDMVRDVEFIGAIINRPIELIKRSAGLNLAYRTAKTVEPSNIFGYGSEKFADSFATSYGYGKDLASLMRKVQLRHHRTMFRFISEIPVLNVLTDYVLACTDFVSIGLDPHPHHATRIYRQLVKLKKDLNDPTLNPKIRKELEQNVQEMQDYIDDVILNPNHEDNRKHVTTFVMNWVIMKMFNGRIDPRELYDSREL